MDGAHLTLCFGLDDRSFELKGGVVFANVPGNLQRPNLPLGMGVRFADVTPAALDQLKHFIHKRMEALEV